MNIIAQHKLIGLLMLCGLVPVTGSANPPPPAPIPAPVAQMNVAKPKIYKPKFFQPHEFRTLKVLTETILRDDEMPGAREAKANEFIDFQIAYDPDIQDRFREGLKWLDRHSRRLHKRSFVNLNPTERQEIIQCLEIKAKHRPGEEEGRDFFELARRYTYMGFYASEEALKVAIPVKKTTSKKRRMVVIHDENLSNN